MKEWNMFKHTLAALIIALLFNYLWGFVFFHEAASIGIIGGADGPTSIYISGKVQSMPISYMINLLFLAENPGIIAFIIMMALFRPIRSILRSK